MIAVMKAVGKGSYKDIRGRKINRFCYKNNFNLFFLKYFETIIVG